MARRPYSVQLLGPTRIASPTKRIELQAALRDVSEGLASSGMARLRRGASTILDTLVSCYQLPKLQLSVFDRPRPSFTGQRFSGELHGDYTSPGRIRIWTRTAKRGQTVAFLTFLDTLLHEFLHHYDLNFLKLPDTVHSENFYKRLGSLRAVVRQREQADTGSTAFSTPLSFAPIFRALKQPEAVESPKPRQGSPTAAPAGPPTAPSPRRRRREPDPAQPMLPF